MSGTPSVEKVIRDFHSDADFVWTDVEVGALVRCIEEFEDSLFIFSQWAKNPTSPGATGRALTAAQRLHEVYGDA